MMAQQRPQPGMSVAARNAEALFEAKNVSEIRQIEARTRQDIEEKNLQLRQLVGDSYRDLIEGTDKIIDISTKCHNILSNISAIQEGFASLAVAVSSTVGAGQDGKESARKHQELHAVGSRVRYLMDSPEVIWGCLDSQQHLEAARRLSRTHEVHDQLQAAFATEVATKFPLLSHQWPLVLKFRQHILDAATSALSSTPDLSTQQAADATAAIALLEGMGSTEALQAFLAGRRASAAAQLEQALAAAGEEQQQLPEQPGRVLAALAQQVQSCISQVGELFTGTPPSGRAAFAAAAAATAAAAGQPGLSLLQLSLQEDEADASELYFGSVDGTAEGSNSPEAVAWRGKCSGVIEQLAPLQRSQVEQACSAWLTDVAALCAEHGLTLLQLCDSADSLLEAELAVQQAMADWQLAAAAASQAAAAAGSADDVRATSDQAAQLGRSGSSAAALLGGAGAALKAAAARGPSDWERTCSLVLGQRLDLWQVLFHQPFLGRCQQLITSGLDAACCCINEPLAAALAAAAQHEPEPAGHLRPGTWPLMLPPPALPETAGLDRTYSFAGSGRTSSGAWNLAGAQSSLTLITSGSLATALSGQLPALGDGPGAFRNEVHTIRQLFDRRLHAVLQAVLLLTAAAPEQAASAPGSRLAPTSSNVAGLTAAARTSSLARTGSSALQVAAAAGANTASAAAAACLAAGKQRAPLLGQFTQQQCLQRMQQLAQQLQQQMAQLPAVQEGQAGANTIEQVLLIARLCHVLGTSSSMLPALLGPPEAWQAACKAGPQATAAGSNLPALLAQGVSSLGPAAAALLRLHHPGLSGQASGSAASVAAAAQLAALQEQLRGIANVGHAGWASWVARSLTAGLAAALEADELLRGNITPGSWLEVKLQGEGLEGGGGAAGLLDPLGDGDADPLAPGDMSFSLPGCPSAALLQMLSLACWETRRAGEHLISPDALQLLEWELHGSALQTIQALAASGSVTAAAGPGAALGAGGQAGDAPQGISEKGVLQLLFDQRLLRDVLGGAQPVAAPASAAAAGGVGGLLEGGAVAGAAAARKQLLASVENLLQEQLDPIDWATYESHLWAHARRYYTRTAVLLGALGQLNRPYADAPPARGGPAADINALNLLPVGPRCHYLPISTPSAALHGAAAKQRLALPGGGGAAAVLAAAAGSAAAAAAAAGGAAGALGGANAGAADLAAQYAFSELGSGGTRQGGGSRAFKQADGAGGGAAAAAASFGASLHLSADSAAAAGASALSALQARLQGSSIGAFGSLLGAQAAEVTAGLGDFLPSAPGFGGGLLSSFARREGQTSGPGTRK